VREQTPREDWLPPLELGDRCAKCPVDLDPEATSIVC
jgi:hypothetical protein